MRIYGSVVGTALALTLGCSSREVRQSTGGETPAANSGVTGGMSSDGGVIPAGGSSNADGASGGAAGATPTASGESGENPGTTPVDTTPAAGASGMSGGGGPSDLGSVWKSSGCGKTLPANQVPTVPGSRIGYTEYHVQQTGVTLGADQPGKAVDRQFFVRVPVDYDPNKAYRVVYVYQACSANTNEGNTATLPLFDEAQGGTEQAVYVAVSLPPNHPNNNCYDNRAGTISQEWEAFQLFHDMVEATYCVDNNRIFMSGYSSGGWVSYMFSCYFGGVPEPPRKFLPKYAVRAIAAVEGGLIMDNMPACNGAVGALYIHDAGDVVGPISGVLVARDNTLMQNGCVGSQTAAWPGMAELCVEYSDCPKDHPVVLCTTYAQGHSDHAGDAIPGFRKFFDMMNPR